MKLPRPGLNLLNKTQSVYNSRLFLVQTRYKLIWKEQFNISAKLNYNFGI